VDDDEVVQRNVSCSGFGRAFAQLGPTQVEVRLIAHERDPSAVSASGHEEVGMASIPNYR
jgi:hypothetical protein